MKKRAAGGLRQDVEVRLGTFEDSIDDTLEMLNNRRSFEKKPQSTIFINPRDLPKLLTEQRIRLIREIRKKDYTIAELATEVSRKRENVSRDLNLLQQYGLIDVIREGREGHPIARNRIQITV